MKSFKVLLDQHPRKHQRQGLQNTYRQEEMHQLSRLHINMLKWLYLFRLSAWCFLFTIKYFQFVDLISYFYCKRFVLIWAEAQISIHYYYYYYIHLADMTEKKVGILESMASLNSSEPSPSSAFCLLGAGPSSSAVGFSEILRSTAVTSLLPDGWLPDGWLPDGWLPDGWLPDSGTLVGSDCATSECELSELARDLLRGFTKLDPSKDPKEDCRFLTGLKDMHPKI